MQNRAYEEYMPNGYKTENDLSQRLNKSICRYDGKPVWVLYDGAQQLMLYDIATKMKITAISYDDPKLDISIMETGYMNYEGKGGYPPGVRYIAKHPLKQWKAGLSGHTTQGIDGEKAHMYEGWHCQVFVDMLNGVYPSVDGALEDIASGAMKEVATSQEVAFGRTDVGVVFVYYRTKSVGWIAPGTKKVNIVDHAYTWVVQRLLSRAGLTV